MTPELLAKIQKAYENIQVQKEIESKKRSQGIKERKAKLYGNTGVKVYHTESGKLSAMVPVGMTSNKFVNVIEKNIDKIDEFKNDMDNKTLTL